MHRHFGHFGPEAAHGGPGVFGWWHARRAAACGGGCGGQEQAHFGGGGGPWGHRGGPWHGGRGGGDDAFDGGGFGVRRPLRFLAYKLELDEPQVAELARILNDLKTDRAQAAVDDRRVTSALSDAIADGTWDEAKARAAAETRVKTAELLRDAVVKALGRIHAALRPDQRENLAYLIRTGTLSI